MDLFDEISKVKKDFPKTKSIKKEVKKTRLNHYQLFSIWLFVIFVFLGIIFGNLFSTCKATTFFQSSCINEFNFSLMLLIWFVGLIISTIIFALGHIILLLDVIRQNLEK